MNETGQDEAAALEERIWHTSLRGQRVEMIRAHTQAAVEREREACAKHHDHEAAWYRQIGNQLKAEWHWKSAAAIRARGEK